MNSFSDEDASHLQSLGRMPPNAPADFWHNTARPKPGGGRHFELMYCNRAYNRQAEMSEGKCTYTVGTVENGDATIYTPGSKGIIAPCDQPMKLCYRDMMKNHVRCHVSPNGAKVVPNGLCAVSAADTTPLHDTRNERYELTVP